ncbi:DUF3515 family protein [Symbioplanes lichenis]|uniref:DUF3515 family protein n=1 Tax=Symbioplanes lichenis TaxID=1629072 RepID=UPI0027390293|nr:DUF3515 family protein [Actinoplanes lichenis]
MTEEKDRTARSAALWATVVAVPVAVLVAFFAVSAFTPDDKEPAAQPSATQPSVLPSTPVPMAAPALSARQKEVCLAVTSQLPNQLRDLGSRQVSAGPEQNAAYGEPPVTVACGVTQPVTCVSMTDTRGCVPMDTELMNMDQVCWFADQQSAATVFTTMDREVAVQVTVPKVYEQPAQWANEFSTPIVETVKSRTSGVPYGCV